MSSVLANNVVDTTHSVDLLLFESLPADEYIWPWGEQFPLGENWTVSEINSIAERSQADYLLLWDTFTTLPTIEVLNTVIKSGVDVAHCGLSQSLGLYLDDLCLLGFSWDKINAQPGQVSTSWRLGLKKCLIRRELLLKLGGLDSVFYNDLGAGLEFGYRCLKLGAIIEHCPELCYCASSLPISEFSVRDFYCFVIRHYGLRWAQYVFFRRIMRIVNWASEWRAWQSALNACQKVQVRWSIAQPWQPEMPNVQESKLHEAQVTVIIPTLGRYAYLPGALDSLRQQSIKPVEVIVVDQNTSDARQPEIYKGYEDLNLSVIWQNECGQSLARNAGLAAAQGQYVFLFDDDSIASPDLLERHLTPIVSGRFLISTGVAIPPPPIGYNLPDDFRYHRLAQTFDTGNALLPLDVARKMGGLDRNYDFGPGTDSDFGTRLYLAGHRILHNPRAIRVHFKAPSGGLRVHGAHKYNTDSGLLQPFPPVTQSYYALRYMNKRQAREVALLGFFLNKFPKELRKFGVSWLPKIGSLVQFVFGLILLPVKVRRSVKRARQLLNRGISLEQFDKSGLTS